MAYKILHVGCGGMGNAWVNYVLKERNDCEIIGLCDIIPQKAEEYKERYNLSCPVFDHIDKALGSLKPDIVFDATTPDAHCEIRVKALRAGCVVFGEKPLAESYEECKKVVKTAKEVNGIHAVMQNRRYLPAMRKMREIAETNLLGKPSFLISQFFIGAHFGGFRDIMDNPLILDMAIHTFDQARFILGSDPVAVYCKEFNIDGSWYKGGASCVAVFEFENGAVYNYCGSWSSEGMNTSWEADWRMICTNGTVICDGNGDPTYDIVKNNEGFFRQHERVTVKNTWAGKHGHEGCFDEMFLSLEERRAAETDCCDNIKSMQMVFGAIESSKTGKRIEIKEL